MSFSIKALAMAGTDHTEWGVDYAEWERMDISPPPPHLYADYEQRDHKEDKEVVNLKQIGSFDEDFGFSVACNHSQDVLVKGIEIAILIAGTNPQKVLVDFEAKHDEIRMQERPSCV